MKRVLHIQKVAGVAGSENHLLTLLPRLPQYGYEPTMLVLADRNDRPSSFLERMQVAGVRAGVMRILGDLDPLLLASLVRFIKRGRYNIVHTHLLHADLYGAIAARMAGVRVVISTRHNNDAFRRLCAVRLLVAWGTRFCDHVICISKSVRSFCEKTEGIASDKMTVIHYGLSPSSMPGNSMWRREFGWGDDVPVVGIVARLTTQKGHACLLRAMPAVLRQFPGAQLVVVGDGTLREELERRGRQLAINDHVRFLGYQENGASMMPGFDVFVHPSRWEGFGMVFLEAMAAGLPIVATQVGSIPEIVRHGQTGLLVAVDDAQALSRAICTLLADRRMAQSMGRGGRRRLEEDFTVANMVRRTCAVYSSLVTQERPPSPSSQKPAA